MRAWAWPLELGVRFAPSEDEAFRVRALNAVSWLGLLDLGDGAICLASIRGLA